MRTFIIPSHRTSGKALNHICPPGCSVAIRKALRRFALPFRAIAWFIPALLLLAAWGCAALPEQKPSQEAPSPMIIIQGVPFFPQEEYQCGPASLASVLQFWRVAVSPESVAADIFSPAARGTLNVDLMIYARKKGLKADYYRGSWDDLREKISGRFPVIVLVDRGISVYRIHHYMVVFGIDDRGVMVHSGLDEAAHMERGEFLGMWKKTDYWTLWVRPQ